MKSVEGFTVDPRTREPITAGFAVGVDDSACRVPAAEFSPIIVDEFVAALDVWDAGTVLGCWVVDGVAILIATTVVLDGDEAIALARVRGQLAVFDLGEQRVIEV